MPPARSRVSAGVLPAPAQHLGAEPVTVATYKILFLGASGAGKTTAIGSISNTPPVRTEVANNDPSLSKALTTVGLDYGEVTAPGQGDQLMLYGCPASSATNSCGRSSPGAPWVW